MVFKVTGFRKIARTILPRGTFKLELAGEDRRFAKPFPNLGRLGAVSVGEGDQPFVDSRHAKHLAGVHVADGVAQSDDLTVDVGERDFVHFVLHGSNVTDFPVLSTHTLVWVV